MKALSPWVRRGLAVACGSIAALAHPPFGFLPGLIGYGLLMLLVDSVADTPRPLRSAFLTGWLAGLAYFAIGVWWVAEAFLVDAEHTGWMAPFAVILLAAGVGLFWGVATLVYRVIAPPGVRRALVFAGVFAALEWLRGHVLTGFPWNLPGETFRAGSALSQAASLVGAYGLSWIVLAISAALAVAREGRRGRIAAGLAAAALVGLWGFGAVRLHNTAPPAADAPVVRIVQANVPQSAKYDLTVFQDILGRYTRLTPLAARRPGNLAGGGRCPTRSTTTWRPAPGPAPPSPARLAPTRRCWSAATGRRGRATTTACWPCAGHRCRSRVVTTSTGWCRSASICRSSRCGWASSRWSVSAMGSAPARRPRRSPSVRACRSSSRSSAMKVFSPDSPAPDESARACSRSLS